MAWRWTRSSATRPSRSGRIGSSSGAAAASWRRLPLGEVARPGAEPGGRGLRARGARAGTGAAGAEDAERHLLVPAHLGQPPRQLDRARRERGAAAASASGTTAPKRIGRIGVDRGGDAAHDGVVAPKRGGGGRGRGRHPADDHVEAATRQDLQALPPKPAARVASAASRRPARRGRATLTSGPSAARAGRRRTGAPTAAGRRGRRRRGRARRPRDTTTPLVRTWSTMSRSDASASGARARDRRARRRPVRAVRRRSCTGAMGPSAGRGRPLPGRLRGLGPHGLPEARGARRRAPG